MLVHFTARRGCYQTGNRYSKAEVCRAPSVKAYTAAVRRFRRAYRCVRTYGAWNEANHVSQPTTGTRAARRSTSSRRARPAGACTIVAADVLDIRGMRRYLRSFLRFAQGKAKIFGLHNYQDVNRVTQERHARDPRAPSRARCG